MTSPVLEQALACTARHWAVLPLHHPVPGGCSCGKACKSIGKHPRIAGGAHAASTDPDKVRNWWQKWPNANLGVATGGKSGIVVVDVDPRHGGDVALDDLLASHGIKLPNTPEVHTGGGGRHWYFRHPGGRIGNRPLGHGLDIRGDGALVVAPPSMHVQGRYEWEMSSHPDHVPLAELPGWMAALLVGGVTERTEKTEIASEFSVISDISVLSVFSVTEAIALTLPEREGHRNRKLFDFCRALRTNPAYAIKPVRELKPLVRQWHAAALPFIETKDFDVTWEEFVYAWPRVRTPMGTDVVGEALKRTDAAELPPALAAEYDSAPARRLIKLCRELQQMNGDRPFYITYRTAGGLLGIDHMSAGRLIGMLCVDGVLTKTKAGNARQANRYRYTAGEQ